MSIKIRSLEALRNEVRAIALDIRRGAHIDVEAIAEVIDAALARVEDPVCAARGIFATERSFRGQNDTRVVVREGARGSAMVAVLRVDDSLGLSAHLEHPEREALAQALLGGHAAGSLAQKAQAAGAARAWVTAEGYTEIPRATLADLGLAEGGGFWFIKRDRWEVWTDADIINVFEDGDGPK